MSQSSSSASMPRMPCRRLMYTRAPFCTALTRAANSAAARTGDCKAVVSAAAAPAAMQQQWSQLWVEGQLREKQHCKQSRAQGSVASCACSSSKHPQLYSAMCVVRTQGIYEHDVLQATAMHLMQCADGAAQSQVMSAVNMDW